MHWYDHNMSWWGAGMGVGMALFWTVLIVAIVVMIRSATVPRNQPAPLSPPPEQILADRFARGEISDTEYRDRLSLLREHSLR